MIIVLPYRTYKNKMKSLVKPWFLSLFAGLVLVACKKDKEEIITLPVPTEERNLDLYVHHFWNDVEFEYGQVYNVNGTNVILDDVRYYLSNFVSEGMMDDDTQPHLEKVLLIDAGIENERTLGEIELDHIHTLNFSLGLDYDTNHADPTAAAYPLNDGTMHWGWNPDSGYKFIVISGSRDPESDGSYEYFEIHAATDAIYRETSMMCHRDVAANGITLHVKVALDQWFNGIDFSIALAGTHGASVLTNSLADNSITSFSILD